MVGAISVCGSLTAGSAALFVSYMPAMQCVLEKQQVFVVKGSKGQKFIRSPLALDRKVSVIPGGRVYCTVEMQAAFCLKFLKLFH